jgi:hypothetical protein
LTPVLELAAGAGLAARARALAILLLDYDAESAAARKALGQILTPEGWRTKEEVAEAEALAKRVAETAEPLTATEASSYESRLGVTLQKVRTPRCRLEGSLSDAEMKDIGRLVEAALEDLTESAGLPMQKGLTRFTAIVCRTREEYEKAVDELADARSESDRALLKRLAGAWMSSPRGFILSPRGTIESYRDGAVHALSHLLFLEWCVPEKAPPWLSEGAAYWATTRITKTALTYCIGRKTSASTREWTGLGEWRGQARSWAREGGGPTVRQVMEAQMNSLDSDKIVKAWSLFDYMVRKRSQGLRALVKRVALGDGREESVRRAFVVKSYEELDAQWREYVNETY